MSGADLLALMPLWIAAAASVLIMLSISVRRNFTLVTTFSLFASAAGFVSAFWLVPLAPRLITPLLVLDRFSLFYMCLFYGSCFLIFLLAHDYFRNHPENREEFFLLVFLVALGAGVLVSSRHFASFFWGWRS